MKDFAEILIRTKEIKLELFPGDEISKTKQQASGLSQLLKCKIRFNHNGKEFLCDEEGNCAQTN